MVDVAGGWKRARPGASTRSFAAAASSGSRSWRLTSSLHCLRSAALDTATPPTTPRLRSVRRCARHRLGSAGSLDFHCSGRLQNFRLESQPTKRSSYLFVVQQEFLVKRLKLNCFCSGHRGPEYLKLALHLDQVARIGCRRDRRLVQVSRLWLRSPRGLPISKDCAAGKTNFAELPRLAS